MSLASCAAISENCDVMMMALVLQLEVEWGRARQGVETLYRCARDRSGVLRRGSGEPEAAELELRRGPSGEAGGSPAACCRSAVGGLEILGPTFRDLIALKIRPRAAKMAPRAL